MFKSNKALMKQAGIRPVHVRTQGNFIEIATILSFLSGIGANRHIFGGN